MNTKAQAAQTLLENDQPERAAAQLGQLSEAAREAYADVREGILGLRTSLGEDRGFIETLQDYLDRWQGQSDVAVELLLPAGVRSGTGADERSAAAADHPGSALQRPQARQGAAGG